MKRFFTAALSAFLFTILFSWIFYEPRTQSEDNVYHFGFSEIFNIIIIYVGPVYFLAGIPLSIFIDKLVPKLNKNKKLGQYFWGLGLYSLAGIMVGIIFLIIFQKILLPFLICCFVASNIYYHLLLLVSKFNKNVVLT